MHLPSNRPPAATCARFLRGCAGYRVTIGCIANIQIEFTLLYSSGNSTLRGDLNGKEIQKRGDMGIHVADSFCCIVETNTTL